MRGLPSATDSHRLGHDNSRACRRIRRITAGGDFHPAPKLCRPNDAGGFFRRNGDRAPPRTLFIVTQIACGRKRPANGIFRLKRHDLAPGEQYDQPLAHTLASKLAKRRRVERKLPFMPHGGGMRVLARAGAVGLVV